MRPATIIEKDEARAALARILPHTPDVWRIARLASLTNRTFLVEREAEAYVLRLPGKGTELYIDRAGEAANAKAAAAIGLTPLSGSA